ncbi:MAG: hypothetical protein RL734_21 [Bacteroidota bacterium]|jgi:hypothetical protein
MLTITKILCLGAIGNYFVVNPLQVQSRISEIHGNIIGMTSPIHCGSIHPSLSMVDTCSHFGISLLPSLFGIKDLSRLAICGEMRLEQSIGLHMKTEFMKIDQFSMMQCDLSTAWNPHDMSLIPGFGLQTEFVSFDDGILHCTELNMGVGAIMKIDEKVGVGILFQYPIARPMSEFNASFTQPLLTIGFGFTPIEGMGIDVDMLMTEYSSGLRPSFSWNFTRNIRSHIGLSVPHSSVTIGLSMLIDDIFVQVNMFNHMYLGNSWHIGMRYCPDFD